MAISRVQAMRPALKDVIDLVNQLVEFEPYITNAVNEWLAEHPEATTTVQNGAITWIKLNESLQDKINSIGPSATETGSSVTADDASAARLQAATIYGATLDEASISEVSLMATGANLWGGSAMHDTIQTKVTGTVDGENEHGAYILFAAGRISSTKLFWGPFKSDTRYTFILKVGRNNVSNQLNMRVVYTDGTYTNFTRTTTDSDGTPETVIFVTPEGKSVDYVRGVNSSGNTYLYYDESGVFEGVLTDDDYQAYVGTATPMDMDGHTLKSDGALRDTIDIAEDGSVMLTQRVGGQATYTLPSITMPMLHAPDMAVWAATNIQTEITATYVRDINLALDETRYTALSTIAPIEGSTASANYSVGSYLIHDNRLCLVVSSIASGEPIVIGQNVTVTTVMAELVRLTQ